MPQRAGLRGHHQPLLSFVQVRQHGLQLRLQRLHHVRIDSHYHILADNTANDAFIYRRVLAQDGSAAAADLRSGVTKRSRSATRPLHAPQV
jgi:hypothetical protein